MPNATQIRIWRHAKRLVAREKVADFINDYRSYFHRRSVGYYDERLILIHRWLINDEQQQIDAFYGANRR